MLDNVINNYVDFANIPRRQRRQRQGGNAQNNQNVPINAGAVNDRRRAELRHLRHRGNVVVQRSPAEVTLMKLLKKRREIGNANDFRRVFERDVNRNPTDGTLAFFYALFRTSNFDVKKIGIESNLCRSPVVIPMMTDIQTVFVTSDSVFWYKCLDNVRNGRAFFDAFNKIKSVMLSSAELIVFPNERTLYSFYTEDFDPEVCAVTIDPNPGLGANDLQDANEDFEFGGNIYRTYRIVRPGAMQGNIILANRNILVNDLCRIVNNQKRVNSKKNLIRGFRSTRENAGAYYVNSKLSLTTFCPATVGSFTLTNFVCIINSEIDPNTFLNLCIQANDFIQIPNLLSWDNLESAAELIAIALLATDVFNNLPAQQQIIEQCRIYFEFKKFFLMMKKLYKRWERIVLMFIDSFKLRVSIDRMRLIAGKCDEYLQEHTLIFQNDLICTTVRDFFNSFAPICEMSRRFIVNYNPADLILSIKEACLMINDTTAEIDSFQEKIRGAGYACFNVLMNGNYSIIPTTRSLSCFLGNLKGDYQSAELRLFAEALRRQAIDRVRNVGNIAWINAPFNFHLNNPLPMGVNVQNNNNVFANLMNVRNQQDLDRLIGMFPPNLRNDNGIITFVNANHRAIAADPGNARDGALFIRRQLFPRIQEIANAGFAYADNQIDQVHNVYVQWRQLQDHLNNLAHNANPPNVIINPPNVNINPPPNVPINPPPNVPINPPPNVPNNPPNVNPNVFDPVRNAMQQLQNVLQIREGNAQNLLQNPGNDNVQFLALAVPIMTVYTADLEGIAQLMPPLINNPNFNVINGQLRNLLALIQQHIPNLRALNNPNDNRQADVIANDILNRVLVSIQEVTQLMQLVNNGIP